MDLNHQSYIRKIGYAIKSLKVYIYRYVNKQLSKKTKTKKNMCNFKKVRVKLNDSIPNYSRVTNMGINNRIKITCVISKNTWKIK